MSIYPNEIYLQGNLRLTEKRTVRHDARIQLRGKNPGPTQRPNNSIPLTEWLQERFDENTFTLNTDDCRWAFNTDPITKTRVISNTGSCSVPFTDDFAIGSPTTSYTVGYPLRLYFDKSKGAFRSGGTSGDRWNESNVGNFSAALGVDTLASGNYSFATGGLTNATGNYSTTFGLFTTASASYSIAAGIQTEASGGAAMAIGNSTTASGDQSFSTGANNISSGNSSSTLGSNLYARSFAEVVVGSHCTDYTPANAILWNAADRVFVVGIGDGSIKDADALTVLKDGRVGIGIDNFETNGTPHLFQSEGSFRVENGDKVLLLSNEDTVLGVNLTLGKVTVRTSDVVDGLTAAGQILVSQDNKGACEWQDRLLSYTPTSQADATQEVGTIAYDASYLYVKTAPTHWERIAFDADGW